MQKLQSPLMKEKDTGDFKGERMSLEVICKYCSVH